MEIKEMLDTFVERFFDNVSQMEKFNQSIEKAICKLKEYDAESFENFKKEIEDGLDCIYYEMVEYILLNAPRKDSSKGIKWSLQESDEIIEKYHLKEKYSDLNNLHFWYALNNAYNIHYEPSRTIETYISLAEDNLQLENIDEIVKWKFNKLNERK